MPEPIFEPSEENDSSSWLIDLIIPKLGIGLIIGISIILGVISTWW